MNMKTLILGIFLLGCSSWVWAEGADGIYAAVDYGRTSYSKVCNSISAPFDNCSDHAQGHRVGMGISLSTTWSGELGYYNGGQVGQYAGTTKSDEIDTVEWQVSALRSFPIGEGRFSLLGKAGYVRWIMTEANSVTGGRLSRAGNSIVIGAGAKFYLTGTTLVRALYEIHNAGDTMVSGSRQVHFISGGLAYYF